mmetsp:Transcript_29195/g.45146  ORF Transcript_29195/g.45146 Transcript_29195/m.45146 type:complete len:83 (-) Transcript_29195:51-299(-)
MMKAAKWSATLPNKPFRPRKTDGSQELDHYNVFFRKLGVGEAGFGKRNDDVVVDIVVVGGDYKFLVPISNQKCKEAHSSLKI